MVTLYSKPNCVQCTATKRWLDKAEVEYEVQNLLESPEALEKFKALGFAQAPIVVTDQETWAGFQPEKLGDLL